MDLGPQTVPFLIEVFERDLLRPQDDENLQLDVLGLLIDITGKHFPLSEWPAGKYAEPEVARVLYTKWWREGRKKTPEQFAKLYADWDKELSEGKTAQAAKTLDLIRFMGVEVAPLVVKKIEQGDDRLVPFINKLMRQDVLKPNADRKAALDWWKANECKYKFPDPPADPPKTAPKSDPPAGK